MKVFVALAIVLGTCSVFASGTMKMNFKNAELSRLIEEYSKASGQKFIVDPTVRGKISIFLKEPVAMDEAFNHLSSALAINGFAISKQGDTMIVKAARNIQRDLIEVSSERPSVRPERIVGWVYTARHLPVDDIVKYLRVLPSRDGEMTPMHRTNQLIVTDWSSSVNRIADILKEIDRPNPPDVAKIVEAHKKGLKKTEN